MKRAGARSPRGIARAFIPLALLMALLGVAWPFTAQAEITVVDTSTARGDNVSSLTLAKPSGTSEGQLMLAQVTVMEQCTRFLWLCLYDVNQITSPTGWNELREDEGAWNFDDSFLFGEGRRVKQAIYYRFASASEPSTYEWSFDAGPAAAAMTVFDGVDPVSPFDGHSGQGGLGITATAPSIRTTTANTMLVALFGAERGNPNIGLPAGMSELYRFGTGGGPDGIRIAAFTELLPQAGDTGPRVAELHSGSSENQASSNVGQLVALRERVTGPDHIRIEHDGQGLTCQPETVTVKACANADCSILYTDPVTTTLSPAGDTVSFSGGQATAQLSWATPGPTTLGAIDTTPPPANPTRCFKGTTESCTMVFSACAGDFTCLETGTLTSAGSDLRNGRLYTKLAEQHFSFDVAALKSDGTLESDFVAEGGDPRTVTVELVAVSSSEVLATQELTFVGENRGRKPIAPITINKASREVTCRVTDSTVTPMKVSYSNDSFAIRPQAFTSVTTTSATADTIDGSNTTATPTLKAGADTFDLTATAIAGYDGTPKIENSSLGAHEGAVQAGTISGDFESASPFDGEAAGSSFTYSEVGYFYFKKYAVYDDEFTSVDEPQGDCLNDFSNTFVNGKVGCKFGNESETVRFGRFIPDHFDTVVTHACTGFSYSGQPFGLKVIAKQKNATIDPEHGVTKNYTGDFAKDITLSDANGTAGQFKRDQASCPPDNICVQAGDFSEGVANLGVMEGNVTDPATAKIAFVFEEPKPPSIIQVRAHDDDTEGVEGRAEGQTEIRYGRMYAERVHEPLETNPLSLSLMAKYFDGAAFVTNMNDSCTAIAIGHLE